MLEPSKLSKIKDNVDLVGLSEVLPSPNLSNSYKPEPSEISLNNNVSLVTPDHLDVTEDGIIMLCNTMPKTESVLNPLTHIPQEVVTLELVPNHLAPKTLSPSLDIPMSQDQQHFSTNLITLQLVLPSMPITGLSTDPESSPTVEPVLITPS